MTIAVEQVLHLEVQLSEREVLRLQGYGARPASPEVGVIVAQATDLARLLARPRALYAVFDATMVSGHMLRAGTPAEWRPLEKLALAVCTIGPELETKVGRLFEEGDLPLAAVLDSAGSAAAENVADQVNHAICQQAAVMQLQAGPRRSPGYSGWPLDEQRAIFELLPADSIGVQLTEGMMMRPIKSISFGVALGQRLEPGHASPCRRCSMASCQFRAGGEHGRP